MPSKQECAFINVWILKRLTACKQSRCFNEFSNILISALIFFNKERTGGWGEEKKWATPFSWSEVSFTSRKCRLSAVRYIQFKFFLKLANDGSWCGSEMKPSYEELSCLSC